MGTSPLDHPVWACLSGPHRAFAEGNDLALRYRRGFSPIADVAVPTASAYLALARLAEPDETLATGVLETHPVPPPWSVEHEEPLLQMVCAGPIEERADGYEPVVLGDADVPAMLALTELTHPGPFGPLTHRLGTYIGIKIEGRLVAMAGERFVLPGYREISAVCTHPDWQGRGFARRLMARLAAAIYDSGLTPFLHVLAANHPAIALYERLGFRHRRTFTLQVLRRAAAPGPP